MAIPVYDWIAYHASTRGDHVAMQDLATGRTFTYAEFDARIGRLAAGLRSRFDVQRGDRVAILAHNSTDHFELQFACERLGAVFAPLNWRLTVPELRFIVGDSRPVVLFYDPEFGETALELSAACEIRHLCGREPSDSGYEQLVAMGGDAVQPESLTHDDVATILYTSGTTGHPKGAIITYGMRFWQAINLTGPARLTADSTCLAVLPLFHVGGLDVFANPVFHYGGKVVVMRAYDPALTLQLFGDSDANITHFIGAPAHFQFMAQLPQFSDARFNPNLLAYVAAAPVPLPLLHQWREQGLNLIQCYGMTETCGVFTIMEPWDAIPKAGSAGKPCLHVAMRLVGVDGSDAAPGEIGEIWVKTPSVTPGYWQRPEATAATFTDGWLRTGDAATIDSDGFYTIVDRWKDMYISGGENVYPAEVEDVLYQLPAVAEAAIIGVADERWGEVGRAIIVLKAGCALSEAEIYQHCELNLARYKHPRSIRFVDALPRNATGKAHKPTLRQRFGSAN
ncbi:MAG TPA: long-chain fatty acid--CoA ligase [Acetobacteraceae bacterium]|nr:long-chain fatty acid--CoA ligase [Acetobacteraceae bacterium]